MKLEQCKKVIKIDFETHGDYNYDVGIYEVKKDDYTILFHSEKEQYYPEAKYISFR